ncbi:uncharacterized protein LOC125195400 [Salvia hispanica]|uniref:uncharacterized protein LOC125195400 n=1 Tax=Salvia hispanica TaxID=49212 RepID=UPI00200914A0|nr:uncharacterized protein LOC125195400 [Salvia hispanica]
MGNYLADGIYPRWLVFVKTIRCSSDERNDYFAELQESARTDVERAFVEYEGVQLISWANDDADEASPSHDVVTPNVRMRVPHYEVGRLKEHADMRQVDAHIRLQKDLIEELWARKTERR